MGNRTKLLLLPFQHVLILNFLYFQTNFCLGLDTIYPGQSLSGNQTISSRNGTFELGFFKPGNSTNYYVGIWYKKIPGQTVVWVANRDKPILDFSSSKLQLSEKGNLVLYNQSETPVWSAESSSKDSMNSTVAVLEDSGNLVLKDGSGSDHSVIVWQSFDHPTDTWLPGAKLGREETETYVSWRSSSDPAPGPYSLGLDSGGSGWYFILKNGKRHWSCGTWLERVSSFSNEVVVDGYTKMSYYMSNSSSDQKENFYNYSLTNSSVLVRYVMNISGQVQKLVWKDNEWQQIWAKPKDDCEIYAFCGAYGTCNQFGRPLCKCLPGFEPKVSQEWDSNSSIPKPGCVIRTPLQCDQGVKDGFEEIKNVRLPADEVFLENKKSLKACEFACLRDCSCKAYSFNGNCSIWQEDLLNIQFLEFGDKLGGNLYLRLSKTEIEALRRKTKARIDLWFTIKAAAAIVALIAILGLFVLTCRMTRFSNTNKPTDDVLIVFKFSDLKGATKNFSVQLGEGGFGSVFKGTLPNSAAIAVKKLKFQDEEDKQFRNEVSTIGKIHHVNLVRLLGFCVKGKKRFLVYDYMPNGSLETHLFSTDSKILDWKTRYQIALGVARGLAYLHDECRECIIHCDIKPENILLDADCNPMLSDFGLAKLLGRDFSRVLTTMKGTRGYLAPEMISGEPITPKSDVFSYGMLLLEIISGRRNWEMRVDGTDTYFPARAATCVSNGGDVLSLLDSKLKGDANAEEVIRACRVACWCIQDEEQKRPSMGQVVQIFEGVKVVNIPPIPWFIHIIINNARNEISK